MSENNTNGNNRLAKIIKKIHLNAWFNCIIIMPLLVVLWIALGWLLSYEYFDLNIFASFKVLETKDAALTYVSLLFAIQIPIFILLLERMVGSGYVKRLILPGVILFRELVCSDVVLCLLLLISSRSSYYYFPTASLTVLCGYLIIESAKVLFDQRKLWEREYKYVMNIVKRVSQDNIWYRKKSNRFLEDIKNRSIVKFALFDFTQNNSENKIIEIKTERSGVIETVENEQIENFIRHYFSTVIIESDANYTSEVENTSYPKIILYVRPGTLIKASDVLAKLIVPKKTVLKNHKLVRKLTSYFKIDFVSNDSENNKLDAIISDVRQQLHLSINENDIIATEQALGFHDMLLKGFSQCFQEAVSGSSYTFDNIRQEFSHIIGNNDGLSKQINDIVDVLNDELQFTIKVRKHEVSRTIIQYIYGGLLRAASCENMIIAAFYDYAFKKLVNNLIYGNDNNQEAMLFEKEIYSYATFRFWEHTDYLLYSFRKYSNESHYNCNMLRDWLELRISDLREMIISSFQQSKYEYFTLLVDGYDKLLSEDEYILDELKSINKIINCSLLFIYSYMNNSNINRSEEQGKCYNYIFNLMNKLKPVKITEALVEIIDKKYAETWRTSILEVPLDGQAHSLPDINNIMRDGWISLMINKVSFPKKVEDYSSVPINNTLAFSGASNNTSESYLIRKVSEYISDKVQGAEALKYLIEQFIEKRKQWEREVIIMSDIDPAKVNNFSNDINDGYMKEAFSVSIFKKVNALETGRTLDEKYTLVGWNQIREKVLFAKIENWHIGYGLAGNEIGRQIALKQNELIAQNLLKDYMEVSSIGELISSICSKNDEWIIFIINVRHWDLVTKYGRYLEKDIQHRGTYFSKVNQLVETKQLLHSSLPSGIYAIKSSDIGSIYVKLSDGQYVDVDIDAYSSNSNLLNEILDNPPDWLIEQGTRDAQEQYLKLMVRTRIFHAYRYKAKQDAEVHFLEMLSDEQP